MWGFFSLLQNSSFGVIMPSSHLSPKTPVKEKAVCTYRLFLKDAQLFSWAQMVEASNYHQRHLSLISCTGRFEWPALTRGMQTAKTQTAFWSLVLVFYVLVHKYMKYTARHPDFTVNADKCACITCMKQDTEFFFFTVIDVFLNIWVINKSIITRII